MTRRGSTRWRVDGESVASAQCPVLLEATSLGTTYSLPKEGAEEIEGHVACFSTRGAITIDGVANLTWPV